MIDIHCHILPGVDDGPKSLDESFEMARFCVADGITHIVATPHCHRYVHLLRADIVPAVKQLNTDLEQAEIPLQVLAGSEIQVTDTTVYRQEFSDGVYCHLGDGKEFTLLEFNWSPELFPADAPELVSWILTQGTTPILAHPERHEFFRRDLTLLHPLVEAGAWVQITVDSLLGNHGPAPQALGETLLRTYPKAVLATDAHNMKRCSGLAAGYAWVREKFGNDRADNLLERADGLEACLVAPLERGVLADAAAIPIPPPRT
jgi:protein-tyrosine phosphatase